MHPVALAMLSFAILVLGFVIGLANAPSMPQPQPYIWTDAWSGKQYIVNPAGGIFPRMNDQGDHQNQWEQPR
jgi:hypothetical protein